MSKKEKLRADIAKLESELHNLEVIDWWAERPHIFEFKIAFDYESNDDGTSSAYFRPENIKLNEQWLEENEELWLDFCNYNKKYPRPTKPDKDALNDDWDYYIRPIDDPQCWEYDYPDFQDYDEKTMRNPNYAS